MESSKYNYCHIEGLTDVGCKRPANEDWFDHFECQNGLVAVVCDGMGGHVGGAVASHTAVEAIRAFLETNYFENPNEAIISAVNVGNRAILSRGQQQPELQGMGATCVLLIVRDGYVYYGSVGDSRIYLVRQHHITQLTKDQSYVQMLVDMGQITHEQAEHHPRKNEITNALGLQQMTPAVVREEPVMPEAGDCFILCSDGLSGMVSDQKIMEIASRQSQMKQAERVKCLVEKARENGGLDNITCVMVEYAASPFKNGGGRTKPLPPSSSAKPRSKMLTIGLPVALIFLAVALGGASWWYFSRDKESELITANEVVNKIWLNDKDARIMCHISNRDSIPTFKAGKEFVTIQEMPSAFGVVSISWIGSNGKIMRIEGPKGAFKTLSLKPTVDLSMESDFDIVQKNDTTSTVKFKQTLGKASCIDLVFKDENGKSLHYIIDIEVQDMSSAMPSDKEDIKKHMDKVKEAIGKERKQQGEEENSDYSKTIHFKKNGANSKGEINICLQTGDGRSSNSNIYVGNKVKFNTKGNTDNSNEAYSMSCKNENVVNITIRCDKFVKDKEVIEISLADNITYMLTIVNDDYRPEKGK